MTEDERQNHAGGTGDAPHTRGGQKMEEVEDRPDVSVVTPDAYPDTRKSDLGVGGSGEDRDIERDKPGNGTPDPRGT